ncbi:hypothetical protein KXD40_007450 [Peronospora effusa]|nr:hypothetical protein KXD40_007450 [Peronospora effusa]CAI5717324.1 unnamed protein product [Peronospora effusa]
MPLTSWTASSSWRGICNKSVLDQILISLPLKYKLKLKLRELVDGLVICVKDDQKEGVTSRAVNGDRDAAVEATNVKEAGQEIIVMKNKARHGLETRLGVLNGHAHDFPTAAHDFQYVLRRQLSINIATK